MRQTSLGIWPHLRHLCLPRKRVMHMRHCPDTPSNTGMQSELTRNPGWGATKRTSACLKSGNLRVGHHAKIPCADCGGHYTDIQTQGHTGNSIARRFFSEQVSKRYQTGPVVSFMQKSNSSWLCTSMTFACQARKGISHGDGSNLTSLSTSTMQRPTSMPLRAAKDFWVACSTQKSSS